MDWITAIGKLTGRCHESRKLGNHTYLKRVFLNHDKANQSDAVALCLHSTNVLTWYPDGTIFLNNGGYPTLTTHDRMNQYLPNGYRVHGPINSRRSENGMSILMKGSWQSIVSEVTIDNCATIFPDGSIEGGDVAKYRAKAREARLEAQRPRNRARYWINKARDGKPFKGTVADIFAEENQTVRLAKMRCYGIEKFFLDAKPTIVDERAGYQLLALPLDNQSTWHQEKMFALKMSCTTTGAVYINPVPPQYSTVPEALDWMFDTKDYLGTIGQQA